MNNTIGNNPGSVMSSPSTANRFLNRALRMMALCMMTLAGAAGLLLTGCEDVNSGPQLPPIHASGSGPVTLGEGDVIKLFFPGASEYSSSQKVRTDGKLSLPLVGEIQAAGKTLPRLQAELTERYKPKLQNSEVVVSLDASGSPVIISGAIASPGKFLFERPTTLLEAIMGAGGFTDYAKRKKVRLIRLVNGQYHTDIYDMSGGLNGRPTPVVYVKGGDVVYIPQSNW